MIVAPIPVLVLLLLVALPFGEVAIYDVLVDKELAVRAVFVGVPIVIILVGSVVDAFLFLVAMVVFLTFVILRRGFCAAGYRCDKYRA